MPPAIGHRNLPDALLRARESVMRYFRPNLKVAGVTEQQWRVIRVLSDRGELEVGQIAAAACIPGPSLTGVLERMERDDWVRRFRISTDQRKIIVELTPKARRLVQRMLGRIDERYRAIEAHLGPQALDALHALLEQVAALPDPAVPAPVKLPVRRKLAAKACDDPAVTDTA
ncbi:MAG: homoprotocatechuate degradation operon regulator HpaR [Caldimonas sp.]|uniref:homoprotocatechuate degradation operon regulator HpaR n=1 Tax=Caldimonas sp. TaxID=2838790 RepID=UPI00391B8944